MGIPFPLGDPIPQGEGAILGVARAIQKHSQSLLRPSLQRRCRVRCNRDHSIANNVMQQTGSSSRPRKRKWYSEYFRAQVMRPIGREGEGGIAHCRRSVISTIALVR